MSFHKLLQLVSIPSRVTEHLEVYASQRNRKDLARFRISLRMRPLWMGFGLRVKDLGFGFRGLGFRVLGSRD